MPKSCPLPWKKEKVVPAEEDYECDRAEEQERFRMIEWRTEDDFDPERIACSGQCFRWKKEGSGWRILSGNHCVHLTVYPGILLLEDAAPDDEAYWWNYFDLSTDYRQLRELLRGRNPTVDRAMDNWKGLRILRQEPFEMLITFIISQRKSIGAIRTAVETMSTFCGERLPCGEYGFPDAAALMKMDNWQDLRLGYRERYVRDAVLQAESGALDPGRLAALPDEELRNVLKSISGVGEKVANCIMLFGFHRMDAFPRDVWIQRAMQTMEYHEALYRGYNGLIQQYLFMDARMGTLLQNHRMLDKSDSKQSKISAMKMNKILPKG